MQIMSKDDICAHIGNLPVVSLQMIVKFSVFACFNYFQVKRECFELKGDVSLTVGLDHTIPVLVPHLLGYLGRLLLGYSSYDGVMIFFSIGLF